MGWADPVGKNKVDKVGGRDYSDIPTKVEEAKIRFGKTKHIQTTAYKAYFG